MQSKHHITQVPEPASNPRSQEQVPCLPSSAVRLQLLAASLQNLSFLALQSDAGKWLHSCGRPLGLPKSISKLATIPALLLPSSLVPAAKPDDNGGQRPRRELRLTR